MYLEASEPKGLSTMSHFPLLAFIVFIVTQQLQQAGGGSLLSPQMSPSE